MTKVFLSLLYGLIFAQIFAGLGCQRQEPGTIRVPALNAAVRFSDEERSGFNRFALDYYLQAGNDNSGQNIAVSPLGAATLLGMVRAGASGKTASEIDNLLHFSGKWERYAEMMRGIALNTTVVDAETSVKSAEIPPPYASVMTRMKSANSLWLQDKTNVLSSYQKFLSHHYLADVQTVDFAGKMPDAVDRINHWIDEKTEGNIPSMTLPVTPETKAVLVNALHFQGFWFLPFKESNTTPEPFYLPNGETIQTPTMKQQDLFGYAKGDGFQAVEMLYWNRMASMVILLPDEKDGIDALEKSLSVEMLNDITSRFETVETNLQLPKFKIEWEGSVKPVLGKMGIKTAFSPAADFSGMFPGPGTPVDDILTKIVIDVDERGTTASSAMAGGYVALADEIITVHVDHPFIFFIRDKVNDSILFIGRVTRPNAT